MIVDKPEIKKSLSDMDTYDFIKNLVDTYFQENEEGGIDYTPYFFDRAFEMYFYLYCVTGIQFERFKDESGAEVLEDILTAAHNCPEVYDLYKKYSDGKLMSCPILVSQLDKVKEQVKDIVEYQKQILIHKKDGFDKVLNILNAISPIMNQLKTIDLSKIDWKVIEEIFLAALLKDSVKNEFNGE